MPAKRQISRASSAPSTRVERREPRVRTNKSPEQSGGLDGRGKKRGAVTGMGRSLAPDCHGCSRSESIELEPFVGPEAVAKFLDIDAETAVRYARLGYLPAHPLHVFGKRMCWRFLLSEVRTAILTRTNTYREQDQRYSRSA